MVRIHNMIVAGKRRNEHNQRTFRKMEVGDQSVDALKRISGIDKDICPAIRFLDLAEKVATLSSVRQLVVPTAMTRPPFLWVSLISFAVSAEI